MGCTDAPEYPDEPIIEYVGINKAQIHQDGPDIPIDSLLITISFTDGDGDLGFSPQDNVLDVFVADSRSPNNFVPSFKIPQIPKQGVGNGISGEITLMIRNTAFGICCENEDFPLASPCQPASYPTGSTNEMYYRIQIMDRAENRSNIIETIPITIQCN